MRTLAQYYSVFIVVVDVDFDLYIRPGSSARTHQPVSTPQWNSSLYTLSAWVRPDRLYDSNRDNIQILSLLVDG